MKLILPLSLAIVCLVTRAHAATYLLLSQTNTFAAQITNAAKAYTDSKATGVNYAPETILTVSTNYTITYTNSSNMLIVNSSTNVTFTMNDGATNGFAVTIKNLGSGSVTLTNAAGKTFDSYVYATLPTGTITHWVGDGTNYRGGRISPNNYVAASTAFMGPVAGSTNMLPAMRLIASGDLPTNIVVSGQMGFTGYTVANLPTGVAAGYQTYATDVLTPWGTGGMVEWDGSVWRIVQNRIQATTNLATYFLNCYASCLTTFTPLTTAYLMADNYGSTAGGYMPRLSAATGTGATALTFDGVDKYGVYAGIKTGTTTNGNSYARSVFSAAPGSSSYFCGGAYSLSALCTSAELYWAVVGFDTTATVAIPVSGAYFLYDLYNVAGRGSPGAETNHWLCVTAKSSSYTYSDSGLTPSISTTTPDRLAIYFTTNSVTFFTNGVASVTLNNASTIPTTSMYGCKTMIVKTNGLTTRVLEEARPVLHIRYSSAISPLP